MDSGARTILILEDEPAVSSLLCRVLEREGYKVFLAVNSAEAICIGTVYRVDVLVCDILLKNETASGALEHLRRCYPRLGVLLLSGFPPDLLMERNLLDPNIIGSSSTFFLQKPFLPTQFVRTVERLLAGSAPATGPCVMPKGSGACDART